MVAILDRFGQPMPRVNGNANGHSAPTGLHRQFSPKKSDFGRPDVNALYDAALSTPTANDRTYWPGVDNFDADRSNTVQARQTTRQRARYLVQNDPLAAGIVKTLADHRVGVGPNLQLLTQNDGFNAMVQARWQEWDATAGFSRKLHTMSKAWDTDGECFGLLGTNPNLPCDVKLDLKLMETDQVFTPWLPWAVPNRVDGIWFDDWGRATFYDVLRWHPGGVFPYWTWLYDTVPAQYVIHLIRQDRPNQHRGMSAFTPSLRLFAQRKRFLEAVVKAAESHASVTILLETLTAALNSKEDVADPATIGAAEIPQNMVAALPYGYSAKGFHAEQPATTFEMFDRRLIGAIARPWSMPYAIAACDSSKMNFSSGRLDHQTYYAGIRVDQSLNLSPLVCVRVFREWFKEACRAYAWSVPDSPAPPHAWNWVEPEYSDPEADANAAGTRLAIGLTSHSAELTGSGQDAKAVHKKAAEDLGFDDVQDYLAWVRANIAAKFGGLARTPQPVLEEQEPTMGDVENNQADVAAMAQILFAATPDQRRQIVAWARHALSIGAAV